MSTLRPGREKEFDTGYFDCLTDGRRRRTLAVLFDEVGVTSERALARRLAAAESEETPQSVADEAVTNVRTSLRHVHLPKLDDADLIDWDGEDGTVAAADHPLLSDPQFRSIVETDVEGWDDVVAGLADQRRRDALVVLESEGELSRDRLAEVLAARDPDELALQLHHVHLPKLDDAGLVDYDPDAGTVAYRGHPALPAVGDLHLAE
ncbi:DUF7344 domain-containing protein [Halomicrobium salinisoli]|uniref:DUF7344 domain-containing protein n=1 Tax=Halomicrobium salinisoli TaxID=2878391 RepID=UPI001CF01AF1|nr:helix-turn-helix transcriptional regulator [Halomicrobium salinisoli]